MMPDAPDSLGAEAAVNGSPSSCCRSTAAWRALANAIIIEVHQLAIAAIDDAATAARLRVDRAFADSTMQKPNAAVALTLGATIGVIGAALVSSGIIHDRR